MRLSSRLSLTHRLTLLFAAVSSSVLLALGLLITASVERHFEDLDKVGLVGKMDLIRQTLDGLKTHDDLAQLSHLLAHSLVGHLGLEVLILGPDNQPLFGTAHASASAPFAAQLMLAHAERYPQRPVQPQVWRDGAQQFRVIVAELATGLPGRVVDGKLLGQTRDVYQPFTVRVAIAADMAHHQDYLRSLLKTLWIFVATATLLIALLGWAAVRSGLQPLRTMREQTGRVTAQQLGQRLPVQAVPQELAELAQSLNDMLARLEEAFQRLTAFSSDIAHELRTPVSNLMTQTQVVLSQPRAACDYRAVLESNAEELDRMARMIADMLLLAKADNGLVVPHRTSVNLADEVHALFDYYDALADEKQIALQLQGEGHLNADRLMLRRALGNLLSNALHHATAGSELRVQIEPLSSSVQISVTNQGAAIAPEHLTRVFDRFFRVDPARQHHTQGVGLGLAITQSIATAHGGTISVVSDQGETTFYMRLPK